MKTFFNVLYRRILYKIPLKFLLILLAVCAIFIACFSNADSVPDFVLPSQRMSVYSSTISSTSYTYVLLNNPVATGSGYAVCISPLAYHTNSDDLGFFNCSSSIGAGNDLYNISTCNLLFEFGSSESSNSSIIESSMNCYYVDSSYKNFGVAKKTKGSSSSLRLSYAFVNYDSLKTYFNSGYIEESSIDSQYCVSNNLCPSNVLMTENQCKSIYGLISSNSCPEVPECPDNPNVGTSNLYINDIFHPGAFNIIMNIPEEISRDYAYTNSGYNFNLDIEGYNVDYEKMQSVIDKQSYIPTNEDFQNIILLIGPYGKIIIFFVFLFILWAWIKKPFKSKL